MPHPSLSKNNKPQTSFSIGILSFNHPEITARTINSCLKLVAPEYIVLCHNGSEQRWVQQLQLQFPEITHHILPQNSGYSGGANELLSRVFQSHEWCLFLTNDVELLELKCPPQKGFYAPLIYRRKLGLVDSMGGLFFPNRGILEHCRTPEAFQAMASKPPQRIRPYIPGTAFWLHRDVYLQVGGFDTTLGTYWEDVDFSQRAWELNFNLGFCERTKMIHSVGKTCHKKRYYTSYLFLRNKYYVSQKYNRRWHSRMVFRLIYWRDWTRDIGRAIWNADRELLAFKVDIAKDLLRKEARDLKTQAQSILSAWA